MEQVLVSAIYLSRTHGQNLNTPHILEEIGKTRPLSVVMAEKMNSLRRWAECRIVMAN